MSTEPLTDVAPAEQPLRLMELMTALDAHARSLPRPLPPDHVIPLPGGLPADLVVDRGTLVPGRYQPRKAFDSEKLQELAESIAQHGIINRLVAFANERGELELIGGERRMRAAELIGLRVLPITLKAVSLRHVFELSGVDNIQRADLTPLEEGDYFERLATDLSVGDSELARRLGLGRAYIQQRRLLARAAPELRQALEQNQITFAQARTIAGALPGEGKAQAEQVKALANTSHRLVTERELAEWCAKAAAKTAGSQLQALGWSTKDLHGAGFVVYAAGERPSVWGGPALLAAVREQKRPAPPTGPARAPELRTQKLLGIKNLHITDLELGWWAVRENYNGAPTFYSGPELDALARPIAAELAVMEAELATLGCTLEWRDDLYLVRDGASRRVWGWDVLTRAKNEAMSSPVPITCGDCGAETPLAQSRDRYRNGMTIHLCLSCDALERAADAASIRSRERRVAATLAVLDPFALKFLTAVNQYNTINHWISVVAARDPEVLALLMPDPGEEAAVIVEARGTIPAYLQARASALGITIEPAALGWFLSWGPEHDDNAGVSCDDLEELAERLADEAISITAELLVLGDIELPGVGFDHTSKLRDDDYEQVCALVSDLAALEAGDPTGDREGIGSDLEGCAEVLDDATYSALAARISALQSAESAVTV